MEAVRVGAPAVVAGAHRYTLRVQESCLAHPVTNGNGPDVRPDPPCQVAGRMGRLRIGVSELPPLLGTPRVPKNVGQLSLAHFGHAVQTTSPACEGCGAVLRR